MIRGPGRPGGRLARRRLLGCLLGCLLASSCAGAAAGGIYKWTDAQGQVHFGDQPGGRNAQLVHLRPAPPPDPQTARRRAQMEKWVRAMDEDNAEQASRKRKAEAKAARREENCRRARRRLSHAARARYLYTQKDGGPRQILSDSERTSALRQMKADAQKYCN